MENRKKAYISVAASGDPPQTLAGGIINPVTNDGGNTRGRKLDILAQKSDLTWIQSKAADISSL